MVTEPTKLDRQGSYQLFPCGRPRLEPSKVQTLPNFEDIRIQHEVGICPIQWLQWEVNSTFSKLAGRVVEQRRAETDEQLLSCWLVNEACLGCQSVRAISICRGRDPIRQLLLSVYLANEQQYMYIRSHPLAPHVARYVNTKSILCGCIKPTKSSQPKSWGKLLEIASNVEAGAKNVEECS